MIAIVLEWKHKATTRSSSSKHLKQVDGMLDPNSHSAHNLDDGVGCSLCELALAEKVSRTIQHTQAAAHSQFIGFLFIVHRHTHSIIGTEPSLPAVLQNFIAYFSVYHWPHRSPMSQRFSLSLSLLSLGVRAGRQAERAVDVKRLWVSEPEAHRPRSQSFANNKTKRKRLSV